jgi:hypothetical protein
LPRTEPQFWYWGSTTRPCLAEARKGEGGRFQLANLADFHLFFNLKSALLIGAFYLFSFCFHKCGSAFFACLSRGFIPNGKIAFWIFVASVKNLFSFGSFYFSAWLLALNGIQAKVRFCHGMPSLAIRFAFISKKENE